jgi:hypothetical protein
MQTRRAPSPAVTLGVLACLTLAPGCARTAGPALADMSLAFAVRTALVNDEAAGGAPVEVRVREGVVTLSGRVASQDERDRVVGLAGRVPGVARVDDRLTVSVADATGEPATRRGGALVHDEPVRVPRFIAAGASLQVPLAQTGTLDGLPSFGPAFRFGRGEHWRPAFAVVRVRADLPPAPGTSAFGDLRMTAVMVGLGYTFARDRVSVAPTITAGYSFNHVRLDPGSTVPQDASLPVAAAGSPAVLPAATLWLEVSPRISVGLSSGYLFTRPRATWLEGDRFARRPLKADTVLVGISAVYWIF